MNKTRTDWDLMMDLLSRSSIHFEPLPSDSGLSAVRLDQGNQTVVLLFDSNGEIL